MLTVKEIANKLKVSTKTIYRWSEKRKIPRIILPGGELRFDEAAINEWLIKRTISAKNIAA